MKRAAGRLLLVLLALVLVEASASGQVAGVVVGLCGVAGFGLARVGAAGHPELLYLLAVLPLVAFGYGAAGHPSAAFPLGAMFLGSVSAWWTR